MLLSGQQLVDNLLLDADNNSQPVVVANLVAGEANPAPVAAVVSEPEISVRGRGILIVSGDIDPARTDGTSMGTVSTLRSVTKSFVLKNTGHASLVMGTPRVTITGANAGDFVIVRDPSSSISRGRTSTFKIKFAPTAEGLRTATVTISSNDSDEGTFTFDINGTGFVPAPALRIFARRVEIESLDSTPSTTDQTDFGSVLVRKKRSVTRTFTIKNTGTATLRILTNPRIVINNLDGNDFKLVKRPAVSIKPGKSTTFKIRFRPVTTGLQTEVISIATNDGDGLAIPFFFYIQGQGV